MDQDPDQDHDQDRDVPSDRGEPAPAGTPDDETPAPARKGFLRAVLALASRVPLPSLGTERHEKMLDTPSSPSTEGEPRPRTGPELVPTPLMLLLRRRETRVGMAALLSCVVLVAAYVVKRSWTGKPIALAINQPADGEAAPAAPDKKEGPPPVDLKKELPRDPATGEGPLLPGTTPAARPTSPLPTPSTGTGTEARLRGDPPVGDASPLPPATAESTIPAVLGSTLPTTLPPPSSTTEAPLPKPPEPPPAASDPLPFPDPVPATTPPAAPEATTPPTTTGLPPVGEAPGAPPTVEAAQAPPVAPASSPRPTPAAGPVRSEPPPTFEVVPPADPPATRASTPDAPAPSPGPGLVVIPSGGRRLVGAVPIVSAPAEAQVDAPRVADGPRFADDPAVLDQVEPVVHVVRPGENFWTISRLYYRSGRFYKALHAANRKQVPDIRELWVGTVLRIPPPEALDRALIDPPGRFNNTDDPATSPVSRTSKRSEPPAEEADLALPGRPRPIRPDPEAVEAPRRPTYKVKPHETLRSIARDTLNDPRRDREIYNLNRDVLDDINVLPAGTTITLPSDATVGRRAAR